MINYGFYTLVGINIHILFETCVGQPESRKGNLKCAGHTESLERSNLMCARHSESVLSNLSDSRCVLITQIFDNAIWCCAKYSESEHSNLICARHPKPESRAKHLDSNKATWSQYQYVLTKFLLAIIRFNKHYFENTSLIVH